MPWERSNRVRKPNARIIELPPPFRLVALRESGDAFAHACARAAELGAGALVLVGRFDFAEFAVVLQPEEPLASARRAFYAGMTALCDTLVALAPPETPIVIEWPDAVHVNRRLVGGGRLGWPDHADERAAPDWLVFGAQIRVVPPASEKSGTRPLSTTLYEEGFGHAGPERLAEGFARHLMVAFDRWQEGGFPPIAKEYLTKLRSEHGLRGEIDENGDLAIKSDGRVVERRELLPALQAPSWLERV